MNAASFPVLIWALFIGCKLAVVLAWVWRTWSSDFVTPVTYAWGIFGTYLFTIFHAVLVPSWPHVHSTFYLPHVLLGQWNACVRVVHRAASLNYPSSLAKASFQGSWHALIPVLGVDRLGPTLTCGADEQIQEIVLIFVSLTLLILFIWFIIWNWAIPNASSF